MKRFVCIFAAVFFLGMAVNSMAENERVDSFECESGVVIDLGLHSYEILEDCGEPISREDIGYTTGDTKLKLEKWVYGPIDGKMYHLFFKAAELNRIYIYKRK